MKHTARQGFTLIELSIVLVIIGLIVGGVLVGQDLIRAAEIRATVSQIEKYNSAVNTFRNKYGYLPGDIPSAQAAAYGFFAFTGASAGTKTFGDGNGMIEGVFPSLFQESETFAFWRHLSDASLIDGSFVGSGCPMSTTTGLVDFTTMSSLSCLFPPAKLGRNNYLIVFSLNGINYYQLTGLSATSATLNNTPLVAMTPIEARNIDVKMDDGMPLTGRTRATAASYYTLSAPGDNCIAAGSTAPYNYDVGTANGSAPHCGLQLQFQ